VHVLCDKPKQVGDLDHLSQGAKALGLVKAASFLLEEGSVIEQKPRFSLRGRGEGEERQKLDRDGDRESSVSAERRRQTCNFFIKRRQV
jgi:hypothetical protein